LFAVVRVVSLASKRLITMNKKITTVDEFLKREILKDINLAVTYSRMTADAVENFYPDCKEDVEEMIAIVNILADEIQRLRNAVTALGADPHATDNNK
jgi:hypothetical protein